MAYKMGILTRNKIIIKTFSSIKSISTFTFLSQEPQLATEPTRSDPIPTTTTRLPPKPASGSPLYNENWRNPMPNSSPGGQSLITFGFLQQTLAGRIRSMSQNLDLNDLLNVFADWMSWQRWPDVKQLFEFWIRSLDKNGKPNKPDVNLYNHYLRANLMMGATAGDMLDLVARMEEYGLLPNTASFNLVLKAMYQARETKAAEKLVQRMEQTGNESQPDDESYDLVIEILFLTEQIDAALKYIDKSLKYGYTLSVRVFNDCVNSCVNKGRLDALVLIIEKCKTMDQNKAFCPTWTTCNFIAEVAMREDNNKLAYYALEFMAKWIARGENTRPAVLLSVDEGLVVSALGTAGRTYSSTLLDASCKILHQSLREKKTPNPESYIGKINAYASLGNLQKAFSTLREFESAYGSSSGKEAEEELFSPFTSLYPMVVACSKKGFETLDSVYFQLGNLSCAEHPYKSVAALNCIVLGCANIWDLDRAYQTFEAIGSSFGLTPDIHSYNALMYAFGRLKKTFEATRLFDHMVTLGIKPNSTSYSLLVDVHLINGDAKSALSVIDEMVPVGFIPSKETLRKVRRRCVREMDYDSDACVDSLAKKFKIRMGLENRRDILFNLEYGTDYA
ncbi:hypothetical protein GH714_028879 [Hevea brasiliensis]|uniref:Pentacotripeptide-repeat region of PRORP domain-containing protein n=1 Tax=Hevea brasiliensis TaxID=3981 RepID=A0A6A6NJK7_HEVBR|nr:hypothetical protein GH714_028879 [Hevea brasiliensis]